MPRAAAARRVEPDPQNDYLNLPALEGLPPLVHRQRRLEARITAIAGEVVDEKCCRAQIDALLVAAGFVANNTGVTCAGYDVRHHHRDGQTSIDRAVLKAELLAAGVAETVVLTAIAAATKTGEASNYASVKPMKGAKVRR